MKPLKKFESCTKFDASVFQGALIPVTINTIKHAADMLFQTDCITYDAIKDLGLFQ